MDYEPQIGGISLKGTSPFVKMVYTLIVAAVIIIIFFIGRYFKIEILNYPIAYKKLFSTEETPYEKVKRQKLEKRKTKTQ